MSPGPETRDEYATAMAGLRKTIEDRAADRELHEAKRVRSRNLAQFDTLALGRLVRPMLDGDPRGWREIAVEIGVTTPDLSRIMAGQTVSVAKIFAVCDWAGIDPRRFYRPPRRVRSASRRAPAAEPPAAPAGRATTRGGQSPARPSADGFTGKALKQKRGQDDA